MAEVEIPHPEEMHEKAENPFTRTVALFVATYAVGLAIATFGGHNVTKEMLVIKQEESQTKIVYQTDENNEWSQFQAKAIRRALYENQEKMLEIEQKGQKDSFPDYKKEMLTYFTARKADMRKDQDELKAKAEKIRDEGKEKVSKLQKAFATMQQKDPYFDFAEVVFQISIVLASVSMLSGKKWAFILSLVLALIGVFLTFNGFTLLVHVPFLEHGGGGH
jgi:K+-sensing histidine kinase KdpD